MGSASPFQQRSSGPAQPQSHLQRVRAVGEWQVLIGPRPASLHARPRHSKQERPFLLLGGRFPCSRKPPKAGARARILPCVALSCLGKHCASGEAC